MRRYCVNRWAAGLIAALVLMGVVPAFGQEASEAAAIETAAAHPPFAAWLPYMEGWYAAAYDTENAYGIWMVQFWDGEGSEIGWVMVNPVTGRIFNQQTGFYVTDDLYAGAEAVIGPFLAAEPSLLELMEDPSQYPFYLDYNNDLEGWGVYLDRGADSIYLVVDFDDDTAFTNPRLVHMWFSEVATYAEWVEANASKAAAAAFTNAELAAAVRSHQGWTSTAEPVEGDAWQVRFYQVDQLLAVATVDVTAYTVIDYQIE
ncbi:MAG: hypothetical protein SF162_17070 [bacterium]|nr:hypothetical protein [bacterium]